MRLFNKDYIKNAFILPNLSSIRNISLVFMALFICGCSLRGCVQKKDIAPEEQIYTYINLAVNIVKPQQKQDLIDLTTGPLKSALVSASDESFKRAYIDKKFDFHSFEILQRRDIKPGSEVQIDYKLSYRSWNSGEREERAPLLETENRATLVYEYGRWAVSNVESMRTSFEWTVGLPLDNVDTKGLDPNAPPVEIESSRALDSNEQTTPNTEVSEPNNQQEKPETTENKTN